MHFERAIWIISNLTMLIWLLNHLKGTFGGNAREASIMSLCINQFKKVIIGLLLISALFSAAQAETITISVGTNTTTWSVSRESESLKFNYTQYVEGSISPVDFRGRSLSPYHSSYEEIDVNDVRLRDRTSALTGSYASEKQLTLKADTNESSVFDFIHEKGTYSFQFTEQWPAILKSSRSIRYSGQEINSREYAGNNLDYAGSSLLYNKEFSKDSYIGMQITRMNATVLATDDAILYAELMPEKETRYDIITNTTGIADLKYRFVNLTAEQKKLTYPLASEGEERYYGAFNINRSLRMKSDFPWYEPEVDWLPCCSAGICEIGLPGRECISLP